MNKPKKQMKKMMSKIVCAVVLLGLSFNSSQAEDPLSSVEKGAVIFDETLPHQDGGKGFAHGSTEALEGGGITGRTDPKFDGHAANYAIKLDHEDAIYQFEVKLEGDANGGIRVGYHMASCPIFTDSMGVGKTTAPVTLAKDQWHSVTVTRVGTHVSMQIGDVTVKGEEPKLTPTIDAIRLTVGGADGSASYRKLKIWKAVKE
jgi:hypothetical protein